MMELYDGMKGYQKVRTITVNTRKGPQTREFLQRVVGYEVDGKIYDTVEEANEHRDSRIVDGKRILLGNGPREILEDVEE